MASAMVVCVNGGGCIAAAVQYYYIHVTHVFQRGEEAATFLFQHLRSDLVQIVVKHIMCRMPNPDQIGR